MAEKTMGPESRPDSFLKRAKDLPSKIGRAISDRLGPNNPLSSSPELVAAGNPGDVVIEDPNAKILQAVAQGTSPQARRRTTSVSEGRTEPDKKGRGHKVRNIVLGTLGSGAVLTSGLAAYDHHVSNKEPINLEGIGRDTRAIPGQVAEWFTKGFGSNKEEVVPPTFDNNLDRSIAQAGVNAVPATEKDIEKLAENNIVSSSDGNPLPKFEMVLPVILQEGDKVIVTTDRYTPEISTNTQTGEQTRYPSLVRYKEFGVKREGSELIPGVVDNQIASIEVFRQEPWAVDGIPYFNGLVFHFARKDGSRYELYVYTAGDVRNLSPLDRVKDAPILEREIVVENGHEISRIKADQKGIAIDPADLNKPILRTNSPDTLVSYRLVNPSSTNLVKGFSDIELTVNPNSELIFFKVRSDGSVDYGDGVVGPSTRDRESANLRK